MSIAHFIIGITVGTAAITMIWNLIERYIMKKNGESEYDMRNYTDSPSWQSTLIVTVVILAITLGAWGILAGPYSSHQKRNCAEMARGYGLDPELADWSFKFECRVTLPGGQLVPEDRIRITSDGEIIVSGDDEG